MGERHLFIRFEGCQLRCAYCDERSKRGREMSLAAVLRRVDFWESQMGPHRFVSLTGGEPLLQSSFLGRLCRDLRRRGYRILLETNGLLRQEFLEVRDLCDLVAMDVKLASVGGGKKRLAEHAAFLKYTRRGRTYIKMVIGPGIDRGDFAAHVRMVESAAPRAPIFLQPVSRRGQRWPSFALLSRMRALRRLGKKCHPEIYLGIQLHKFLNLH